MRSTAGKSVKGILFSLLLTVPFVFLFPRVCIALPREVILFPSSASVTETTTVVLLSARGESKKAVFHLPAAADPDSLVTRLTPGTQLTIVDQRWEKVSLTDSEKLASLRQKIQETQEGRNKVHAAIQSLDFQIQFWQLQTKAKAKNVSEASLIAAAIGKNVQRLVDEKINQEGALDKIDKKLGELREELNRISGSRESVWEVTLLLAGPQSGDTSLTYSYTVTGCGWQPLYRLDARPASKEVKFSWEAEIWQSTGADWDQTKLSVATLQPSRALFPPDLPPWIIKPATPVLRQAKYRAETVEAETPLETQAQESLPEREKKSTYTLWKLGKISVPAGTRQIVRITNASWPADFIYLARPALGPQVFVRASVILAEPEEIPSGNAVFMIDGAMLGKHTFELAGREATILFGVDPSLTVTSRLLTQKSGERTLFADRQTYRWDWRFEIANGKTTSVRIRVEEPKPQTRDERIVATVKADPPPAEEDPASFFWIVDVAPGRKSTISTTVKIEAPKDFDLDLGWRK